MQCIPKDEDENSLPTHQQTYCYYMLPCFFLFDRSPKLLKLVLNLMGSLITESSSSSSSHSYPQYAYDNSNRINAVVSALILMHKDTKVQKIINSFKEEVVHILQIIHSMQVLVCISIIKLAIWKVFSFLQLHVNFHHLFPYSSGIQLCFISCEASWLFKPYVESDVSCLQHIRL